MKTEERAPITPGELLRENFLEEMDISQEKLARHIGVSLRTINTIVNGKARITPVIAAKLGSAFGTSPEYWLKAQMAVDLWKARKAKSELPAPIVQEEALASPPKSS